MHYINRKLAWYKLDIMKNKMKKSYSVFYKPIDFRRIRIYTSTVSDL